MRICQVLISTFIWLLFCSSSQAQILSPEDVQDLNEKTGVGCISKDPVTEMADFYFICKSRKSGELAWNAAMYRSKVACSSDQLRVFFNVSPSLPIENGFHGAQIEVGCGEKP